MPTSKDIRNMPKAKFSEVSLDLSGTSLRSQAPKPRKTRNPKLANRCGPPEMPFETNSVVTASILHLELPDEPKFTVNSEREFKYVSDSSKSTPKVKKRGRDFNSSSNSHFEGWVLPVPKHFQPKCLSVPSISSTKSSTLSADAELKRDLESSVASQIMTDTEHRSSGKRPNRFTGPQWKVPCKGSFVAGAPRPYIGTCPRNLEEVAKMAPHRQKFFLTQDPRKSHCLRNPDLLRRKPYSKQREFNTLSKMVKHADNVCADSVSQKSDSFICEIIDPDNPLELDFQGMDYKNTYEQDEQDFQNQRIYRRIGRYMDRRRVKVQTKTIVDQEQQAERVAVPECFKVTDRNDEIKSPSTEELVRYGKLFRAIDKPENRQRLDQAVQERRQRFKNLYLQRKAKAEEAKRLKAVQDALDETRGPSQLVANDFNELLARLEKAIEHSTAKTVKVSHIEPQGRRFPHTMRETEQFKRTLKQQKRVRRDEALVRQKFFLERLGEEKSYAEAEVDISSDKPAKHDAAPLSEQSTDDEDKLAVGQADGRMWLRGFHFKLGDNIRGKRHQRELLDRKPKGCQTREEWMRELAPKKQPIKLDVVVGIEKVISPDDPTLGLFNAAFGSRPPRLDGHGAIRQYCRRRLGRHYDRQMRKNMKLVQPRLPYVVKKFNLISFLYGETDRQLEQEKKLNEREERNERKKRISTLQYIEQQEERKRELKHAKKLKRQRLLGLPCHQIKKSRLQTLCENSESESNSDWVPEKEPDPVKLTADDDSSNRAEDDGGQQRTPLGLGKFTTRQRGNMPAPKHRESTLRQHPRRPRDYAGLRVPSQLFEAAVAETRLPILHRLDEDTNEYANVGLQHRPYTDLFEIRHHHDHWQPTQQKNVHVHYQARIAQPQVTTVKRKMHQNEIEHFRSANPPSHVYENVDLTAPKYDIDGIITEHLKRHKKRSSEEAKERTEDLCHACDFVRHSRPPEDFEGLNFPGRQEYLNFLSEIRAALDRNKAEEADESQQLAVNKEAMYEDLEEELRSIKSCLTSYESSECTNLSNDSGSFLLMEGKTKVPLDYIRKALVPFEELQRSRFHATPIDVAAEDANPFQVLPYCGQKKAQLALMTAKDSFFTFNSRLKNGLRLRLEVPITDTRQKLLGRGKQKYAGRVTTDIDANYVEELKNRPPVKMFNFITGRSFIKEALRLKFESMLIEGEIVRNKIYDRRNELHWRSMQQSKMLYERLFAKWEKREYDAAMAVVHQVKSYYDETDRLKHEFRDLERQQIILNMDIVFLESHWIRRIMLQNFHYLLADQDWRIENDWIHRLPDSETELESFEDSIAKRSLVNIRVREKDDARAIITFYEEVYMQNLHPILIVFRDADSFLEGIENLKMKTFVMLLELHYTMSMHTELQGCLERFQAWCMKDLHDKEEYVSRKCAKLYFIGDRAKELHNRTLEFLDVPINQSFNDDLYSRDRAVIAEVWRQMVPANVRGSSDQDLETVEMVAMISDIVVECIGKFETIPVQKSRSVEIEMRKTRAYLRKISVQAYQVEKGIEREMKILRRNLEPPYRRPKLVGKLPRHFLKHKEKLTIVHEKRISEHARFFFRAFHEGDMTQLSELRDSLTIADNLQKQIVPFYFDHFLKQNGYTPNYNFKTQVELHDGPELDRLKVRSLVPELIEKLEKWEAQKKKIMEDNITRNPKMYVNVNF